MLDKDKTWWPLNAKWPTRCRTCNNVVPTKAKMLWCVEHKEAKCLKCATRQGIVQQASNVGHSIDDRIVAHLPMKFADLKEKLKVDHDELMSRLAKLKNDGRVQCERGTWMSWE